MRFSTLLVTSALCLTPAVYAYGVAEVTARAHADCHPDDPPNDRLIGDPQDTVATEDTCEKIEVKHGFDIDAYSVSLVDITKDTSDRCHALGIYANGECMGLPNALIPFFPGETQGESRCFKDTPFDKYLYVRLLCDADDKDKDNKDKEDGPEQPESEDAKTEAPEEPAAPAASAASAAPADKPSGGNDLLSSLGL
ncbi:protein ccpA [Aspergillus ibericus CBS 121593]|uniref:Uncharacterized protein n=1 Tax=Aspergillus ibericus CBS 121593 TaxID=1448316 RepID=A0A395GRX3_9EURO|nr:hypothetical protein BO80DRAFT_189090 [Aspergillus ibericus CBS 121593]RAK97457.1 hypothetical protein BO80DRAFT_189090 [Aspergillus ibericus CBS 121593]